MENRWITLIFIIVLIIGIIACFYSIVNSTGSVTEYLLLSVLLTILSILGSSLGGIQTQLMGFRAMIGTNAALILAGAIYVAVVSLRVAKRARQEPAKEGG